MKVTWGLENASHDPKTITTLGSYDGMHLGHLEILRHLITKKKELALERSLVITFDPHPQEILRRNNTNVDLLTTIEERLALLEQTGVDETLVIRFSLEFAKTPYNDFFRNVLIEQLGTKAMVVGFNHAFGKNREGDIAHLRILAIEYNISVEEMPPYLINGTSVSSTKIRQGLLEGDLKTANEFLGRPYEITGIVEHGDKLGKKLGFATANLKMSAHKLTPKDGVYAGEAIYDGTAYPAAISIGTRPTIEEDGQRKVEAYILDFEKEIYGKELKTRFLEYLREQKKFDTYEELIREIASDVYKVRNAVRH